MAKEVRLPEISENVESGEVVSVLVSEGDTIEAEQPIIELETEKAAVEIPSPEDGTVEEILVNEGDTVEVGQVILKLGTKDAEETEKPEQDSEDKAQKEEPPGSADREKSAEEEAEAAAEAPREAPEERERQERRKEAEAPERTDERRPAAKAPAAPSVRRLARELGVDITQVRGSLPGGRISHDDVKAHTKEQVTSGGSGAGAGVGERELPDFSRWGEVERKPMSKVRAITADSTHYSWSTIPHVTQFDQADVTDLEEFRERYGKHVEQAGGKLTITAIILKVVGEALKAYPRFNASLDMQSKEIVYKRYVHVGVAVDTDRGLLVPVIRDVDKKGIQELSIELGDMAQRTRNKKIKPDEMEGGNFTVSNLGGIGGTQFTPIVYSPQVAILGVARAATKPVYRDGQFVPRLIVPLSLSYDHRIIDGADGARFLRFVAEALEQPMLLFFKGEDHGE
jgi:pyruvate dehydrogenase E2 component (dihydrolipoamide acetyltransferase)